MTDTTDTAALREKAESIINLLDNLAGFEPQDIDMDAVELRFEDENGVDTGCDISIVDTAQQSADVIRALLDRLEAGRQRAAGSEEELHKALHREKAAERKLLAAQEEIAALKAKLANPVVLKDFRTTSIQSTRPFNLFDIIVATQGADAEAIIAAGFTVKGE